MTFLTESQIEQANIKIKDNIDFGITIHLVCCKEIRVCKIESPDLLLFLSQLLQLSKTCVYGCAATYYADFVSRTCVLVCPSVPALYA